MLIFFVREETRGVSTGVVQGQPAMFRVAREDAVRQICEKLKQKLNEFYELESYDWLLVEPQGHASSFISDLIAFLQTTFQSFTNLPVRIYAIRREDKLVNCVPAGSCSSRLQIRLRTYRNFHVSTADE
jgi:hypothetical protein